MMPRQLVIAVSILLLALLGLGVYALHLKQRADELQRHTANSRPIAPPLAGPNESVNLMVATDSAGTLQRISISVPLPQERSERARHILRSLFDYYATSSQHPVPQGSDVNAVFFVSENLAVVDLNSTFADKHPSGILVEELSVASIAQTLSANIPNVTRLKILIDGKERETLSGHVDLRATYDVSNFNALASL